MVRLIQLTKGKVTAVDDDIYDELSTRSWHVTSNGYAASRNPETKKIEYLHRYIMKPKLGYVVDHINKNKLDNTSKNLRVCTQQENAMNAGGREGKSSYRGVSYKPGRSKPWRARLSVNGEQIILGDFVDERMAALAYNKEVNSRFGEIAQLNDVTGLDFEEFIPKKSKSGIPGVSWCNTKNRWRVTIQIKGKKKHLGYVKDIEDAKKLRASAEMESGLLG